MGWCWWEGGEEDRECETKAVTVVRVELSVSVSDDKNEEWRTETKTEKRGVFFIYSLLHTFIHASALLPSSQVE